MVKFQHIWFNKLAACGMRDINTMDTGHFLGQGVRGIINMIISRTGTIHYPIQPGQFSFMLQNTLRQRAAANITQTNHQYLHGANIGLLGKMGGGG